MGVAGRLMPSTLPGTTVNIPDGTEGGAPVEGGDVPAADDTLAPAPEAEELAGGGLSQEDLQKALPEITQLIESLYHLLTKAKNPEEPAKSQVQIENPLTTNVTTTNAAVVNETEEQLAAKHEKEMKKLATAFLKEGSKMTQQEYDKKCTELDSQLKQEASVTRSKTTNRRELLINADTLLASIINRITTLTS
jgi:hypothetical protein